MASVTIGVGGPVGSGKTALLDRLCRRCATATASAVVTNDIYTHEDAEFLMRSGRCRSSASAACRPAAARTPRFAKTRRSTTKRSTS